MVNLLLDFSEIFIFSELQCIAFFFNPIQTRLFETLGRPLSMGETRGVQRTPLCFLRTVRARDLKLGIRNKHDHTNKMTSFVFSCHVTKC